MWLTAEPVEYADAFRLAQGTATIEASACEVDCPSWLYELPETDAHIDVPHWFQLASRTEAK